MAVKIGMGLEGAEEVKATIADIGKAGEDLVKKLNNLGTSQNPAIQKYIQDIKSASVANTEHGKSVDSLSRLYHLLSPAIRSSGGSLGEFRAFSVAARLGVAGLAGALGATLIAALVKLADSTEET